MTQLLDELAAARRRLPATFRKRMGWQMPWFETKDSFNADFDVTDGFGLTFRKRGSVNRLNCFVRQPAVYCGTPLVTSMMQR